MMIYLDKEDVTYINEQTVAAHGGNFIPPNNFLHEELVSPIKNWTQVKGKPNL